MGQKCTGRLPRPLRVTNLFRGLHTAGARNDARFVIASRFAIEFGANQPGLSGKTAWQSAPDL